MLKGAWCLWPECLAESGGGGVPSSDPPLQEGRQHSQRPMWALTEQGSRGTGDALLTRGDSGQYLQEEAAPTALSLPTSRHARPAALSPPAPRPEPPGTAPLLFCVSPRLGPEPLTPPLGLRASRDYRCSRPVIRAAGTACGCSPSKYMPGLRAVPGTRAALRASVQEDSLLRGTVRQVNAMKPHSPERSASRMQGTAGSDRELPGADSGRALTKMGDYCD